MGTHVAQRQNTRHVMAIAFVLTAAVAWAAKLVVDGGQPFHNDEFRTWGVVLTVVAAAGVGLARARRHWGWRLVAGTVLGIAVALLAVVIQTLARSA